MRDTRANTVFDDHGIFDPAGGLSPDLGFPEFSDDLVIDLRDPAVADGLARTLEQIGQLSEQKGAAEARAEIALHERLAATGRLRTVTQELEDERSHRHQLELENAELQKEAELRHEQLATSQAELGRVRDAMDELTSATDDLIAWLQTELREKERANATLEALIGRRRRRNYDRLMDANDDI